MAEDKKISNKKTTEKKETTTKKSEDSKAKNTTVKKVENKPQTDTKKVETKPKKVEKTEITKKSVKETQATKVTTKPVAPKYVSSKEAKNTKKGQLGLVLLIVVIIAISIFFINTFRKYAILVDLTKKASDYITSENYHEIATYDRNFESYGACTKIEAYRKGNTVKSILYMPDRGIITTINSTTAGSKMFMDLKTGNKVLTYDNNNKELFPAIQPQDIIGDVKFLNSIFTRVHSEKLDDVDCYVLDNKLFSKGMWTGEPKSYKIYIEKETGLTKQLVQEETVKGEVQILTIKYTYQFDNVKDDDLKAPSDIGKYIIQK